MVGGLHCFGDFVITMLTFYYGKGRITKDIDSLLFTLFLKIKYNTSLAQVLKIKYCYLKSRRKFDQQYDICLTEDRKSA